LTTAPTAKVTRRVILKALGLSPAGAHLLGEQAKLGLLSPSSVLRPPSGGSPVQEHTQKNEQFTSFQDWFDFVGKAKIKEWARDVYCLDADLVERRLPLATKVRLQRERNYERIIKERRSWFERTLRRWGTVSWGDY